MTNKYMSCKNNQTREKPVCYHIIMQFLSLTGSCGAGGSEGELRDGGGGVVRPLGGGRTRGDVWRLLSGAGGLRGGAHRSQGLEGVLPYPGSRRLRA